LSPIHTMNTWSNKRHILTLTITGFQPSVSDIHNSGFTVRCLISTLVVIILRLSAGLMPTRSRFASSLVSDLT
jgi:hypothetical protein